jgi:two-component system, LytTR family, response regulator AlgR
MTDTALPIQKLDVLIVDDETLARARMRTLLADCTAPACNVIGEAADAMQAMAMLRSVGRCDLVLLDIHMPGADGMQLARELRNMPAAPAIVFVTAHAEHAVNAFELEALDYLTKPVRLERLQKTLEKVLQKKELLTLISIGQNHDLALETLIIQDRGRTERVPLSEVLYFKAELKYITVRTASKTYILDGSLSELEEKYPTGFLRIHRNALVAKSAMRALEKHFDAEEGDGWAVRLRGLDAELLAVSRRQVAAVRAAISQA